MKNKKIYKALAGLLSIALIVSFVQPPDASAATAPDLGAAAAYSVFGKAQVTNTGAGTHVWGNVGADSTVTGLTASQVDGSINTPAPGVEAAILSAYGELNAQGADGGQTLSGTVTVNPGTWTVGAAVLDGTVTLDGAGVYIFRSDSSVTVSSGAQVLLTGGATACDVYWQIPNSMTIGTNATMVGTILASTELISLANGATLEGRALSRIAQVTMDNNQITEPVCGPAPATLNVIKTVINDNGGTAVASDFTINVSGTNVSPASFAGSETGVSVSLDAGSYAVTEIVPANYTQTGSGDCTGTIAAGETRTCTITNNDIAPQLTVRKIVINDGGGTNVISDFELLLDGGVVAHGVPTATTVGAHTVSETAVAGYTVSFGGDCAADGTVTLAVGDDKECTITNNDIPGGNIGTPAVVPPLIDVVKVPSPLSLPGGPGAVEYTYTLNNIGTVPVTDVTMAGDTCSPLTLISGDTNADAILAVDETWTYTCTTTLTETHTNIVTATGWANGINAVDTARATVVVGLPIVPPLINVTKVPNSFLLSNGGGMITYTNKVTNPGTVALSNVNLSDDKCSPVTYVSGDVNGDSRLDINETWTYNCQSNLTQTTVNTITATGEANGLTARDTAIATVVVDVAVEDVITPKLPAAGLTASENNTQWYVIISSGVFGALMLLYATRRKQTV